jgi:hypothetical protein
MRRTGCRLRQVSPMASRAAEIFWLDERMHGSFSVFSFKVSHAQLIRERMRSSIRHKSEVSS